MIKVPPVPISKKQALCFKVRRGDQPRMMICVNQLTQDKSRIQYSMMVYKLKTGTYDFPVPQGVPLALRSAHTPGYGFPISRFFLDDLAV